MRSVVLQLSEKTQNYYSICYELIRLTSDILRLVLTSSSCRVYTVGVNEKFEIYSVWIYFDTLPRLRLSTVDLNWSLYLEVNSLVYKPLMNLFIMR